MARGAIWILTVAMAAFATCSPVAIMAANGKVGRHDIAPSSEKTGSILSATASIKTASIENSSLKNGLDALSAKDAATALSIRNTMSKGSLDRDILTWSIAVSGQNGVPSAEIAEAQSTLAGWPGLERLRGLSELALYRENPDARSVLNAFGDTNPETTEGTVILARALLASGNRERAAKLIKSVWRKNIIEAAFETTILKEFSSLISADDHKIRMDLLLYKNHPSQAKRFAELGQAKSLYEARVAVDHDSPKAGALIKAIDPKWQNDPSALFARIVYQQKQDNFVAAAALLAKRPQDEKSLVVPGQWWDEQRIVSRGLLDQGKFKEAYNVVADHAAMEPTDVAEAEFHAGWYALRGLQDGALATKHFQSILKASNKPITASRAFYWLGRAAEQSGSGKAKDYYSKAAAWPSTFYGQLATNKLGLPLPKVTYPTPTDSDRSDYKSRESVLAIRRLEDVGYGWRADNLYRGLAEQLNSPGELALLAASAEKSGNHQLSLQIGKTAYARGINVAALAFPMGVIPDNANISASGKALAYAIARQESAFNPAAVSSANARGLLQLLPGTAKNVAKSMGIAYSKERLTSDPGYNAALGSHYLGQQISDFGGSYILTFIAYNAGPKRVPEWIKRYGDPRGKTLDDIVDWVERIPFSETRNYVQRVMENYQVYKARLGQTADIAHDLQFGR